MSQSSPTRTEFIAGKLKTVIDAIIADKELSFLFQPLFIPASVNVSFLKEIGYGWQQQNEKNFVETFGSW